MNLQADISEHFSMPGLCGIQSLLSKRRVTGNTLCQQTAHSGDCLNAFFAFQAFQETAVSSLTVYIRRGKMLSIRGICDPALLRWHITSRKQKGWERREEKKKKKRSQSAVQHEQALNLSHPSSSIKVCFTGPSQPARDIWRSLCCSLCWNN